MAAGNGDVYNIEYIREHRSNIDITVTRSIDTTSVRSGVQLDMRDAYTGGALYEVVIVGDLFGMRWCHTDRNIRSDSLADTYFG